MWASVGYRQASPNGDESSPPHQRSTDTVLSINPMRVPEA